MLEDRSYMRRPRFQSGKPATVILLIVNTVLFIAQQLVEHYLPSVPINNYLYLSLPGILHGYVWQFFTFQMLHAGLLHLFFNCWGIYVFGRAIEDHLGKAAFLRLYFLSGAFGGLCFILLNLLIPALHSGQQVVGASAGLFGLIAAYATLFPDRQLTLFLFFILPITLTARWLLIISAGLAVFGILIPNDTVAHAAHLGGLLAGLAYVRWGLRLDWNWLAWRGFKPSARPRELVRASSSRALWQRAKPIPAAEELPPGEFISREVDPILDKISAHGIQSLTDRERKILEAARAKMAKR